MISIFGFSKALEITYKDSKDILSEKEEIALINSFLFEVDSNGLPSILIIGR